MSAHQAERRSRHREPPASSALTLPAPLRSATVSGIAYTNRTGKPVEPERWSDISWIAVLLCLLKIPFQWPWCYLSAKSMHAHRGNMTHLRLTLNGMDKWTALLAHALQVSELTDHDSLVNKHLPKHHEDKQHVRVKNEYLSRVLGEEFWHGQGDYDAWLPQSTMAFVKKVFYKLNTSCVRASARAVPPRARAPT